MTDLVLLVADANMEHGLNGILGRPHALGIRPISWKTFRHPGKDAGCLRGAHEFLKPLASQYARALVFFDLEGCGKEQAGREQLEDEVSQRLSGSGWLGRSAAIAFEPELEIWFWSQSPHITQILGWKDRRPPLRDWLQDRDLWRAGESKPWRPKEALEAALREVRVPRSSSIYHEAASRVSFAGCADEGFHRLRSTLQSWFPQ